MNRYPWWKYTILAIALVIGLLYTLPNLYGEAPAVQVASGKATVKVDSGLVPRIEDALKAAGLSADFVQFEGNSVKARFGSTDDQIKAKDAIAKALNPDANDPSYIVALNLLSRTPTWLQRINAQPMFLGLDLRGGVHFLMQVDMKAALTKRAEALTGDIRTLLPVPTHSEHDHGAYITAGLVIARNPRTGVQNVSINRIEIHGPDRLGILILPRHLHTFFAAAEAKGEALEVAIVIGVDPLTALASQAIAPIDCDELEIAGALHGKPLSVVKCLTNEVRVPAEAEIVIEGRLLPRVRELEGPFGEFPKYYSAREEREVIAIDAVTHRRDPVFHTIVPAEMEHLLLGAIPREATLLAHLQRSFPNVTDVHLTVGGVARYHLVVQLRKTREGQAKNVMLGAFAGPDAVPRGWTVIGRVVPDRAEPVLIDGEPPRVQGWQSV